MVYPFLLMISTGTKGPTDQTDNKVIPAFWTESSELFRKYVDDKYGGVIDTVAMFYGQAEATKLCSSTIPDSPIHHQPLSPREVSRYEAFLMRLPLNQWQAGFRLGPGRISSKVNAMFQSWLLDKYGSVDRINLTFLEQNAVLQTVQPPAERFDSLRWKPIDDVKWRDWQQFKSSLPANFRIPITTRGLWTKFLRDRYKDQFAAVPRVLAAGASSFEEIPIDTRLEIYDEFVDTLPASLRTASPDSEWLKLTHEDRLPQARYEAAIVERDASALRRSYSLGNYGFVLDYVLLHGRAIFNTVLFCLLAVLTHLIVNPLAAYALSRFSLSATSSILLFLLATMAFPAEVTMIPSFLLLRDLGLLNTFAALVLPTAASGYSIYLLKGFFDSLPRDLYESAAIEGAKESTMLFRVTLPLCKPVLAVIALSSFMAAYSAFMYAFLVAQDERMWTLTVWIYQLQSRAPKGVLMAALALAALPTLLVFLAAQRVILRGIILPGEK
jgi:multiple sugar transport system permease protein